MELNCLFFASECAYFFFFFNLKSCVFLFLTPQNCSSQWEYCSSRATHSSSAVVLKLWLARPINPTSCSILAIFHPSGPSWAKPSQLGWVAAAPCWSMSMHQQAMDDPASEGWAATGSLRRDSASPLKDKTHLYIWIVSTKKYKVIRNFY